MVKVNLETKPLPLKKGDLITTISVSSPIEDYKKIIEGLKIFESWGLICKDNNQSKEKWGYLAGNDHRRHCNLNSIKLSPLIVFTKGGWGAARVLELPSTWKKGWFLGYSDITSLLLSRLSSGFDGCIHGPMVSTIADEPDWSKKRLKNILFGEEIPDIKGIPWKRGIAKGPLVVANLTVASHLIGTNHMPDLTGSILILEDIGECPYRIDRMLTHWRLAGLMNNLAGLGFGNFVSCEDNKDIPQEDTFKLKEVLKDRVKDIDIPIIADLPVGHINGNAALPLGRSAILNANKGILKVISY